mgnify:CR=1 FL=1
MARYRYRVVTSCGAAAYTKPLAWSEAIPRLRNLIAELGYEDFELERVLELERGLRRYWLWRDGAWVSYGDDPRIHHPTPEDYAHWRSKWTYLVAPDVPKTLAGGEQP